MPEHLQSIAAIAIVTITVIATALQYAVKRRKIKSGTACAGGCGCSKKAPGAESIRNQR